MRPGCPVIGNQPFLVEADDDLARHDRNAFAAGDVSDTSAGLGGKVNYLQWLDITAQRGARNESLLHDLAQPHGLVFAIGRSHHCGYSRIRFGALAALAEHPAEQANQNQQCHQCGQAFQRH